MERLLLSALFALAWTQTSYADQFIFHAPTIEIVEVPGMAMQYPIEISRTGTAAEISMARTITLTTNCPAGVATTASSSDYSVASSTSTPLQVTFMPNFKQATIMVTINDDSDYESTEIFCLSISEELAGSQNTIKLFIPENDYCYEKSAQGVLDLLITSAVYAGPWFRSMSDTVEFEVTQGTATSSGANITIFLAEAADTASVTNKYYTIVFDYSAAMSAGGSDENGDTLVYDGAVGPNFEGKLIAASDPEDFFVPGVTKSFWLRYNAGTISVGSLDDRTTPIGTPVTPSGAYDVKHIFLLSGSFQDPATFKLCSPGFRRKLQPVQAVQYENGGNPERAIDGSIGPAFTSNKCFVTTTGNNPWLQIDLGKVYEVTNVLIWPVTPDTNFNAIATDIDNAEVRVGNCPPAQITDNTLCFDVQGRGTSLDNPIEDDCQTTAYGRYVYIYKAGTATQFSFCEVEIDGKEVTFGQDTTVQFQEAEYTVNEDDGLVTIMALRNYPTGVLPTCTSAEYYTDRTVTPSSGNSNDFNPTDANVPINWDRTDDSGTLNPIKITINDDNPGVCEPIETFNVYLTNMVGGIAGTPTSTTVRIVDRDTVNYSFSMARYTAMEGKSFSINVLRSGNAIMQPGTAGLIFADVTTTTSDYTRTPTSVTFFSDSALTVPANVPTSDDEIYDPNETLTVSLGALTPDGDGCSDIGTNGTATLTITDNDSRFRFSVIPGSTIVIPEGQMKIIEISREGTEQQKSVEIVISEEGTAVLGIDFSITPIPTALRVSTVTFDAQSSGTQQIIITTENDSELGIPKTFTLTLRDPLYPEGNRADPYSLAVSIVNNDAEYFWKQNSYSVTEGAAFVIVCLIRTGVPDVKSIDITTVGNTALAGSDFTLLQQIEFEKDKYEACAPVQITVDTLPELTKTFTMQISNGQDVVTNPMTDTTTVSILDDDTIISFSKATYSFMEGQSGLSVMIYKTGNPSVSFTLTITSRTATQNNDFILNVGSTSSLTIPMGTPSLTLPIIIIDDELAEQAEQFTLTISGASGGTISTPTATITITDNDMSPPIAPIITPPAAANQGIGGLAIAAVAVSASIGAIIIIIIIAIAIFVVMRSRAFAAAPAVASTAAAANEFQLTNYRTSYNPYYM